MFVRNSSHPVYDDCSMKKQPISTAVVLEFCELLIKNELQNGIETLASYMNVSIFVIVIGSFFILLYESFFDMRLVNLRSITCYTDKNSY